MGLAVRVARILLPQGLPLHMLLEATEMAGEDRPERIEIVPHRSPEGGPEPIEMRRFKHFSKYYAEAVKVETFNLEPGEYLAVVYGGDQAVLAEECFWVLDHADYESMLDELRDEEFDFALRIHRAELHTLLDKKLIEAGDEKLPLGNVPGSWASQVSLTTRTSGKFVKGGTLPISKMNFGFDCLVEDFMYLSVFNNPSDADEPGGVGRSIHLDVNETGDVAMDARAELAVPFSQEFIEQFNEYSAMAQASAKWPGFFESYVEINDGDFHLRFTISPVLRGRSLPEPSPILPAEAQASARTPVQQEAEPSGLTVEAEMS